MRNLNDPTTYQSGDPEDMRRRIRDLPKQIREAWRIAQALSLPEDYRAIDAIVVLGMGGSAIGGDLLRTLVVDECRVPIFVCRDYDVPGFVDDKTLVIASSYSGATEETLSAFGQARDRGAKLVVITTGGTIATQAEAAGAPALRFSYDAQPRAALGYSFIPLLGLIQKLGLIANRDAAVEAAAVAVESLQSTIDTSVPTAQNAAKQLAAKLQGHLPVVYGAGFLSEVARRWKGQFNENSKAWSFFEIFPEVNHNAVVGYEFPANLASQIVVVLLKSPLLHPRTLVRYQVTQQLLRQAGVHYEVAEPQGTEPLGQVLTSIHFGDFVSYYLALLYGADPTPVKTIAFLKEQLAKA